MWQQTDWEWEAMSCGMGLEYSFRLEGLNIPSCMKRSSAKNCGNSTILPINPSPTFSWFSVDEWIVFPSTRVISRFNPIFSGAFIRLFSLLRTFCCLPSHTDVSLLPHLSWYHSSLIPPHDKLIIQRWNPFSRFCTSRSSFSVQRYMPLLCTRFFQRHDTRRSEQKKEICIVMWLHAQLELQLLLWVVGIFLISIDTTGGCFST